jgi:hypothetical protein
MLYGTTTSPVPVLLLLLLYTVVIRLAGISKFKQRRHTISNQKLIKGSFVELDFVNTAASVPEIV